MVVEYDVSTNPEILMLLAEGSDDVVDVTESEWLAWSFVTPSKQSSKGNNHE